MAGRIPNLDADRRVDSEDMFVSTDSRSMSRGRRVAPRTEVCRPCLVWQKGAPQTKWEGVFLDLNPYGMRLRMLELHPVGSELMVQLMRDDGFREALSPPILTRVMRTANDYAGFIDHGIQVKLKKLESSGGRLVMPARPVTTRTRPTRMYSMDTVMNALEQRRSGRNRG